MKSHDPAHTTARSTSIPREALVLAVEADGKRVRLRLVGDKGSPAAEARVAVLGYVPSEGDRVVVVGESDAGFVIGVLHAAAPAVTVLADGASVRAEGRTAEIVDPSGHLVARYHDGAVHLAAARGDLVLGAPDGKVSVHAGRDIELRADRDVVHHAARTFAARSGDGEDASEIALSPVAARVSAPRVDVRAEKAEAVIGDVALTARRIATTAEWIRQSAGKLEVTATRLVETARDTFRDVAGLAQTRVGRARTLVGETFTLHAKRTAMKSEEDTSIDGRRVLLG